MIYMVWKMILPLETRHNKFGKCSPSSDGPYRIVGVVLENLYFVETLEEQTLSKALNRKYLKR
jgi:hypothetical protein